MDTRCVIRITTWSPEVVKLAIQRGVCLSTNAVGPV